MTNVIPIRTPASRRLELLRLALGTVFVARGAQKFFEFGLAGTIGAFSQMGIPLAGISAPLVMALELVGGALLLMGLLTRFVAPLLALVVLGATLLVHLSAGFFNPDGVEFTLTLFAAAVALTLTGPGAYALDNVRRSREDRRG